VFSPDAIEEFCNTELLWTNAVKGRKFSTERVITPAKNARAFQGQNICSGFDNAERTTAALLVTTKYTLLGFGKKSAEMADFQIFPRSHNSREELIWFGIF
jgi:hypothetical protein